MAKTKVIGGKTVANLPTTSSGTGQPGTFDPETGGFIPRPRPVTEDQKVGIKPANKRLPGIGVGGHGESLRRVSSYRRRASPPHCMTASVEMMVRIQNMDQEQRWSRKTCVKRDSWTGLLQTTTGV